MEGSITMSNQEAYRISIMEKVKRKEMTQKEGADLIQVTERQVRRLLKLFYQEGPAGLVHHGRGKPSNRRVKGTEVKAAVAFLNNPLCADFAPTFAHEQLIKNHLISFGVDSVRRMMIIHQLWTPHKRKTVKLHQLRERWSHFGDMVQMDGSPHDWLEGRIDPSTGMVTGDCTLHTITDDATSQFKGYLGKEENTLDYFRLIKRWLLSEGKPRRTYTDRHSIFRVSDYAQHLKLNHKPLAGEAPLVAKTQFQRAMDTLQILMILAYTPQAKGRVENLQGTLQDRLVKELRLRNICSLEAANAYLPVFEAEYNAKFAVVPKDSHNAHQPLTDWERDHLSQILAVQETRTLSKNLTCQYDRTIYQVKPLRSAYTLRHAQVQLCQTTDGPMMITRHNQVLPYTVMQLPTKQLELNAKQLDHLVKKETGKPPTFWETWAETSWNDYDPQYQLAYQ